MPPIPGLVIAEEQTRSSVCVCVFPLILSRSLMSYNTPSSHPHMTQTVDFSQKWRLAVFSRWAQSWQSSQQTRSLPGFGFEYHDFFLSSESGSFWFELISVQKKAGAVSMNRALDRSRQRGWRCFYREHHARLNCSGESIKQITPAQSINFPFYETF